MEPVVSVVNLEDEFPSSNQVRTQNQLDRNMLTATPVGTGEFDSTLLASGQSSGDCSSPPEGSVPRSTAPSGNVSTSVFSESEAGDQLIRDVIFQLERQCSTSNEEDVRSREVSIGIGDDENTFPPTSILSGSNSAGATAIGNGVSPIFGSTACGEKTRATSTDPSYSSWIASAKTRETLASLSASGDGRICYTMPGIMIEESFGDPTVDALKKHCGNELASLTSHTRAHLSVVNRVNVPALLELVSSGNFRAAIDVTGKLLKSMGQGKGKAHQPSRNTEESLKIWNLRLHLLVSIGQYNVASSEIEPFGSLDAPDLYFEYYPETYPGRKGSMVPFSMRLLHAEAPRMLGQHQESLTRLNRILAVIRQIIRNISDGLTDDRRSALALWTCRLRKAQHALARCFLGLKEFRLAAAVYDGMMNDSDEAHRSLVGRIDLMLGNLIAAKAEFQKFQLAGDEAKANIWSLMHNAYMNVASNNFAEAVVDFEKAAHCDPSNIYAINNAAVCHLYLGQLHDAVVLLENAVQQNPESALQEGICTNLCTLYELESARSAQKKISVLKSLYQYKGDGLNVACLKLPA